MARRASVRKKLEEGFDAFFENGFAKNWAFKVHVSFADQLDIARTSKGASMGNCFSFEGGDVFYDDEAAYELDWKGAREKLKHAVCIEDATPSSILSEEERSEDGSVKKKKYVLDGNVKFSFYRHQSKNGLDFSKAETLEMSQYEFAEFLRTGQLS